MGRAPCSGYSHMGSLTVGKGSVHMTTEGAVVLVVVVILVLVLVGRI
jgi:hypothetical protein